MAVLIIINLTRKLK